MMFEENDFEQIPAKTAPPMFSIVKVSGPDWIVDNGSGTLVVFPDIVPKYAAACANDPLAGEAEHISEFCKKNTSSSRLLSYHVRFIPLEGSGLLAPEYFEPRIDSSSNILLAMGSMNHMKCKLELYFSDGLSWEVRHSFHRSDTCLDAEKTVLKAMDWAFEKSLFKSERFWIGIIKERLELMQLKEKALAITT